MQTTANCNEIRNPFIELCDNSTHEINKRNGKVWKELTILNFFYLSQKLQINNYTKKCFIICA
jgi:hypothetical protein